jgi:hypothetical protein
MLLGGGVSGWQGSPTIGGLVRSTAGEAEAREHATRSRLSGGFCVLAAARGTPKQQQQKKVL